MTTEDRSRCAETVAALEAHRAWLADCITVLRRFTHCSFYGHSGAPADNPRERRIDCPDEQCVNPEHVRVEQCARPEHDAAELVAAYDAAMSRFDGSPSDG